MKQYNFKLKDGEGGYLVQCDDDEQAEKMRKALEEFAGQEVICDGLES